MTGSEQIHFSELFASTVAVHGLAWAWGYYSKKGMTRFEFRIWAKGYFGV